MLEQFQVRAASLDAADPLSKFRERFAFPQHNGRPVLYFTGNSLGLQPLSVQDHVIAELEDWRTLGVEGHMHARHPWFSYHRMFQEPLAAIVGAKPHEVVAMNSLTVNLHLMMISFYRPTEKRFKILLAGSEFPSDRYAIESQIRLHGHDVEQAMIELQPAPGTSEITDEQITAAIREHGDSLALVLFSGVHYYSGQFFNLELIAREGRAVGASVGFDLAHAVGNVELKLHEWGADFAVWCTYKYLNSGPGGVGGCFVHERHAGRPELVRLAGWWGNDETTRFQMAHGFEPTFGADGWQLSNAPVLSMAAHKASLEIFQEAGMPAISAKRDALTSFLEEVIHSVIQQVISPVIFSVITPSERNRRGAQLSVRFETHGRDIFEQLMSRGVVVDWRHPNVIRIAPAPLYCTYTDIVEFGKIFADILKGLA